MKNPLISVVMPAYNAAAFLREAIDSVLLQRFTDFEFIIINDGSVDESDTIIRSYPDPRIVYLVNETNKGLVFTLNRGVENARGQWIARFDADDICKPDRLEKQIAYAAAHPDAKIIATTIELIDESGNDIGIWNDDRNHTQTESIHRFLPFNNCIAHPTVLIDTRLLQTYRYDPDQRLSEDYDLWLRLHADGYRVHKLGEPLLRHRILKSSFTRTTGKNLFFKLMRVKRRFAWRQMRKGKWSGFVLKTFFSSWMDAIKGAGKVIKQKIS